MYFNHLAYQLTELVNDLDTEYRKTTKRDAKKIKIIKGLVKSLHAMLLSDKWSIIKNEELIVCNTAISYSNKVIGFNGSLHIRYAQAIK